jgi:hypothetical protein
LLLQFVLMIMTLTGLALLVVPSFFIFTMFYVSAPAQVLEDLSVRAALARSRALTQGNRWAILAIVILITIPSWLFAITFDRVLFAWFSTPTARFVALLARNGITGLLQLPLYLAIPAAYLKLRRVKEGVASASTVAVFD